MVHGALMGTPEIPPQKQAESFKTEAAINHWGSVSLEIFAPEFSEAGAQLEAGEPLGVTPALGQTRGSLLNAGSAKRWGSGGR